MTLYTRSEVDAPWFNEPVNKITILHDERSFTEKGILDQGRGLPRLKPVYECYALAQVTPPSIPDVCFEEFNIGVMSTVSQEYRSRGLRSLSTGDVVVVGGVAWRCDSTGWTGFALYTETTT